MVIFIFSIKYLYYPKLIKINKKLSYIYSSLFFAWISKYNDFIPQLQNYYLFYLNKKLKFKSKILKTWNTIFWKSIRIYSYAIILFYKYFSNCYLIYIVGFLINIIYFSFKIKYLYNFNQNNLYSYSSMIRFSIQYSKISNISIIFLIFISYLC
jgi:hypothetical protein